MSIVEIVEILQIVEYPDGSILGYYCTDHVSEAAFAATLLEDEGVIASEDAVVHKYWHSVPDEDCDYPERQNGCAGCTGRVDGDPCHYLVDCKPESEGAVAVTYVDADEVEEAPYEGGCHG